MLFNDAIRFKRPCSSHKKCTYLSYLFLYFFPYNLLPRIPFLIKFKINFPKSIEVVLFLHTGILIILSEFAIAVAIYYGFAISYAVYGKCYCSVRPRTDSRSQTSFKNVRPVPSGPDWNIFSARALAPTGTSRTETP